MSATWDVFVEWPESFADLVDTVRAHLGIELILRRDERPPHETWFEGSSGDTLVHVSVVEGFDTDDGRALWYADGNFEVGFWRDTDDARVLADRLYDRLRHLARRAWLVWDGQVEYRPLPPSPPSCPRCPSGRLYREELGAPPRCESCAAWIYPDEADYPRGMPMGVTAPHPPCPRCRERGEPGELRVELSDEPPRCSVCRDWFYEGSGLAHDDTDDEIRSKR